MIGNLCSFIHMLYLDQEACEIHCREKRLARYERHGGCIRFLGLHSFVHCLFLPLLKLDRIMKKQKLVILRDSRRKTAKPVIYCPTHIGGMDIEMSIEAIRVPCWPVIGDPREMYKQAAGMMLQMNGCIFLDVQEKQDRIAAKAQMKALLEKGGNLLIFPEGVQNISPNVLVNHLYPGAVELAITCGAEIVPMALARDGATYYCAIGENIDYADCDCESVSSLVTALRDQMATLLWEIMELLPGLERSRLSPDVQEVFVDQVMMLDKDITWSMEDIIEGQYRPKGVTVPEEALLFHKMIRIGTHNAFVAREILRHKDNAYV